MPPRRTPGHGVVRLVRAGNGGTAEAEYNPDGEPSLDTVLERFAQLDTAIGLPDDIDIVIEEPHAAPEATPTAATA